MAVMGLSNETCSTTFGIDLSAVFFSGPKPLIGKLKEDSGPWKLSCGVSNTSRFDKARAT